MLKRIQSDILKSVHDSKSTIHAFQVGSISLPVYLPLTSQFND